MGWTAIGERNLKIKIISFNIDGLSSNREELFHWKNRKNKVFHMFEETKPDIFGLQEACRANIEEIKKRFPEYIFYIGPEVKNKEGLLLSNPIFWNQEFEMIKNSYFYLAECPETGDGIWDSAELRTVSWILLKHKEEHSRLLLINTHLDHKGVEARRQSANMISCFAQSMIETECCNVILIGDFNSRPWYPQNEDQKAYGKLIWPGYLPVDSLISIFLDKGFEDSYLALGHENILESNTYNDYLGSRFPSVGLRIDWQLLFRYLNTYIDITNYVVYDQEVISDHYPIVCTYDLSASLEDYLYAGKNKVFRMCCRGKALKKIADFLRQQYPEGSLQNKNLLYMDFYELIWSKTHANMKFIFDLPSYNAVVQNGIVRMFRDGKQEYILKYENEKKPQRFQNELKMYKKLKSLFPTPYFLGSLDDKNVYLCITPPVSAGIHNGKNYFVMKRLDGKTFDEIIYSYKEIDQRLLKFYAKIIFVFLSFGFMCADISPRNVILEETKEALYIHVVDFEKSYFVDTPLDENEIEAFLRGQICGEEMAVLFEPKEMVKIMAGKYNPKTWDINSKKIMDKAYRPEVEDILTERGEYVYNEGMYNRTEKEMQIVLKPNRNAIFEGMRFPGRIKFKAEHYLACLGYESGLDYERKITEIFIKAKKYDKYSVTVNVLHNMLGELEERILIDYLIGTERSINDTRNYALTVQKTIDGLYECVNQQQYEKRLANMTR